MGKLFRKKKSISAFTLAEVLITLMIIGVVAVLVIPAFITNINKETLAKQQELFSKKFTEGLNQMRVDGLLNQKYERTEDFVAQMQKYFKINGICDNTNLSACFPEKFSYVGSGSGIITDEKTGKKNFKTDASKSFTLSDADTTGAIKVKTAKNIKDDLKYDTNVMGITFADGVQMLLYVNPNCEGPAEGDTQAGVTACISYLADVNQAKSPNQIEKDIVGNITFANLDFEIVEGPKGISMATNSTNCPNYSMPYRTTEGRDNAHQCAIDYCNGLNAKLPTKAQLLKLADTIYPASCLDPTIPVLHTNCDSASRNITLFNQLGDNLSYFYLWVDVKEGNNDSQYFSSTGSNFQNYGIFYTNNVRALCVR